MSRVLVLAGAVVLGFMAWAYLFLLPRAGLWSRTWAVAVALSAASVAGLAVVGELSATVGPVNAVEVGVGLAVGALWLACTHVGHWMLCRLFPSFMDEVQDLYAIGTGDRVRTMVGPIVAMGVAEELLFRGVVQGLGGLAVGVVVYTAVQLVERKWVLALAALLGGLVWGVLFEWRSGLVAPTVAHVLWTATLTFVLPLRGCRTDQIVRAPADRVVQVTSTRRPPEQ